MRRRSYLRAVGGVTAGVALAGCVGGGGGSGTLATEVSDQPGDIGDFESCVITITEIRVKPSDAETATGETGEDAAEESISVDDETADLVDLQGEESQLVSEQDLETGDYDYLKLIVSNVDATLSGGGDVTVNTPGDAPLKFNTGFEIRADTTTRFTADFTPVKQGARDVYVLQPVAQETEVSYE